MTLYHFFGNNDLIHYNEGMVTTQIDLLNLCCNPLIYAYMKYLLFRE